MERRITNNSAITVYVSAKMESGRGKKNSMSANNSNNTKADLGASIMGFIVMLAFVLIIYMVCCGGGCSSGKSQYDRDLENGIDKLYNGRINEMTEGERQAANDFIEWQEGPN